MKKEVVPFDIAIQLRDLGFDEPCFGYKVENEHFSVQVKVTNGKLKKQADKYSKTYKGRLPDMVACPLWQQAFRFLLNKCETHKGVRFWDDGSGGLVELGDVFDSNLRSFDSHKEGIEILIKLCKTEEK